MARVLEFRTPLGLVLATLREKGGAGKLLMSIEASAGTHYIDAGKYSAVGALAFFEAAEIHCTSIKISITAIPRDWVLTNEAVLGVLKRSGLHARIVQMALSIEGVERFVNGASTTEVENCLRSLLSLDR